MSVSLGAVGRVESGRGKIKSHERNKRTQKDTRNKYPTANYLFLILSLSLNSQCLYRFPVCVSTAYLSGNLRPNSASRLSIPSWSNKAKLVWSKFSDLLRQAWYRLCHMIKNGSKSGFHTWDPPCYLNRYHTQINTLVEKIRKTAVRRLTLKKKSQTSKYHQ